MQNWDSATGTCGTGTEELGHLSMSQSRVSQVQPFAYYWQVRPEA